MTRPGRWIPAVVVVMLGAGCAGSPGSSVAPPAPPSVTTPVTIAAVDDEGQARRAVDRAVDTMLDAGSYAFKVEVVLVMGAESIRSELEGWVDGSDRELQLKIGDDAVISRVIDGVATVERDGTVTEVPLERVDSPPSLEILRSLDQATLVSSTEIAGFLETAVLESAGFDSQGIATVALHLSESGALAGYEIRSSDSTWTVHASFSGLGSSFSS